MKVEGMNDESSLARADGQPRRSIVNERKLSMEA